MSSFERDWIYLTVRITPDTPPGALLDLDAVILCNDPEPDYSNNEDTLSVQVRSLLAVATVGSGTVTSNPAGIDCGETCGAAFDAGTSVTLTATPDEGSGFAGWSGDCTGSNLTATVTMDSNRNCTAAFGNPGITVNPTSGLVTTETGGTADFTIVLDTRPTADVTIELYSSDTTEGTVSPASMIFSPADWDTPRTVKVTGVNDAESDGSKAYTVQINPAVSTDPDYNGLDPADVSVTNAEEIFTLVVTKDGMGTGTVTTFPVGINCGATCSADFGEGANITLTATADAGFSFAGWSATECPGTGSCTVILDRNHTVTASFEQDSDHDGAGDDLEDSGPNAGDGNGDGTLDSAQANVATFRGLNGSYVTLVSEAGTQITDATATTNPSQEGAPESCSFPGGFFGFTITGLTPGQETILTTLLHTKNTALNTYYKYGPTPGDALDHWYEFKYGGTTGATITQEETQTRIVLHLTDGATGDDDLLANGAITDVGAPGTVAACGGGGGCFIDTTASGFRPAQ